MNVEVRQVEKGRLVIEAGGFEAIIDRDTAEGVKQGFRPVELFLGALGACTAGTLISFAESQGIDVEGVRVSVDCEVQSKPERVSSISMVLDLPGDLSEETRARLLRVAKHCKIHNTLHREPEVSVELADIGISTA